MYGEGGSTRSVLNGGGGCGGRGGGSLTHNMAAQMVQDTKRTVSTKKTRLCSAHKESVHIILFECQVSLQCKSELNVLQLHF